MATSQYREWATKVPYLDSLLTLYTAFTFGMTIRNNYSDPVRMFIQDPAYMHALKNNDVMSLESLLALFLFTMPFMALLAVVGLHASLRTLRVAMKRDSERVPQSAWSMCGTWCKICMFVLFQELH